SYTPILSSSAPRAPYNAGLNGTGPRRPELPARPLPGCRAGKGRINKEVPIMRGLSRWLLAAEVSMAALVVSAAGMTSATAAPLAASRASFVQSGPASPTPAAGTPELVLSGTDNQVIRQIVQCGTTMYAVGSFSQISQNGTVYARNNIFSFSAVAPYTITSWAPGTNGVVNSIALTSDCGHAYIGGKFFDV